MALSISPWRNMNISDNVNTSTEAREHVGMSNLPDISHLIGNGMGAMTEISTKGSSKV
jgi:hypothetical protein